MKHRSLSAGGHARRACLGARSPGQSFAAYMIVLFALMALGLGLGRHLLRIAKDEPRQHLRQMATEIARAGFSDAHAFYRRQYNGVNIASPDLISPTAVDVTSLDPGDPNYAAGWPLWPDGAFQPGPKDTHHFAYLSDSAGIARAILKSYPLHLTGSAEMTGMRLWGRSVVKRQSVRNWGPGANTPSAQADPEAAHDLTHLRSGDLPGAGAIWSVTSRGYIFNAPTDLTDPAAFSGGLIENAPLETFQGRSLKLASAKVYGEIVRLNFQDPRAAVYVRLGSNLRVNTKGVVTGADGYAIARSDATAYVAGGGTVTAQAGYYYKSLPPPSIGAVFPGFTLKDITNFADYVGGINVFPDPADPVKFKERISRPAIYVLSGAATFPSNNSRRLTGIGLAIVNGDLTIQTGNLSSWGGVCIVLGNTVLNGPAEISGALICTGSVTLQGGSYAAAAEYNSGSINTVTTLLLDYRVNKSSLVTSYD